MTTVHAWRHAVYMACERHLVSPALKEGSPREKGQSAGIPNPSGIKQAYLSPKWKRGFEERTTHFHSLQKKPTGLGEHPVSHKCWQGGLAFPPPRPPTHRLSHRLHVEISGGKPYFQDPKGTKKIS